MQPRPISHRGLRPSRASWLACLPLLGALLALAAGPARALTLTVDGSNSPYTLSNPSSSPFMGDVTVNNGGNLTVTGTVIATITVNTGGTLTVTGGSVGSAGSYTIDVEGGSVTISGGSVSNDKHTIKVNNGSLSITGGSVAADTGIAIEVDSGSGSIFGGSVSGIVSVNGGDLSISGGSFSGGGGGRLDVNGGAVSISGCGLQLAAADAGGFSALTGNLADGTPIDIKTLGLTTADLVCTCCDTSPPTTMATATAGTPPTAYTAGTWTNQSVTVSLSATDPDGMADVKQITYSANGAQTINPTVVPSASASVTIRNEGTTTVSFFATDGAGNQETTHSFVVKIDQTAPTVSFGTPAPAPNAAGWNNTNVSIPFTASDSLSGVASTTPNASPLVLSTEGSAVSGMVTVTDNAGNSAAYPSPTVKIDRTPPVVTYSGNAGSYTVDQTVNITCSASDSLSGVDPSKNTCQNISGPAYSFSLGLNSFSATASDNAGNTGSGKTSFTVQVTSTSLSHLVSQLVSDPSVVQGLNSKLSAIDTATTPTAKAGAVAAFINQVQAQTGKSISPANAAILIKLSQAM